MELSIKVRMAASGPGETKPGMFEANIPYTNEF